MDSILFDCVKEVTPKLNPLLADGFAYEQMKMTEHYIDRVWKSVAESFVPGLEYCGYRRLEPWEEFDISVSKKTANSKNNKASFDIARSDFYMVEYIFKYNGVKLKPRHVLLPFVEPGGYITIGGGKFVIAPVLADKVFSIGLDNIFTKLLRDKIIFKKVDYQIVVNGEKTVATVIHSRIYNVPATKKVKATVRCEPTIAHYLFCKYGVTKTFELFCGFTPVIGDHTLEANIPDKDNWVICKTTGVKPRTYGKRMHETPNVYLAVPKDKWTNEVRDIVAGFFYVVDHFPTRIKHTPNYYDDTKLWIILLGSIYLSENVATGNLYNDFQPHIESLDSYIDTIVAEDLGDLGYHIKDVYQLFFLMIQMYTKWMINNSDDLATMYGKQLQVLYYVLMDITKAIFTTHFSIKATLKNRGILTERLIEDALKRGIRTGLIYGLNSSHGEVMSVSSPGDNKAFKVTSMLVPQQKSTKGPRGKDRGPVDDPTKVLHASIAEVGGYVNITKKEATGRSRLNLCVKLDPKGSILRDPRFVDMIDKAQELIK
ncbi:MAG: hypothetical protein E6Q68_06165 [Polynucleobacter sp.]|nr:MAG: hypothetical protein E6Q68_06165 [Polynucleobacter sp.]